MTYRLGLIVNPLAGMGGAVGLKGTDGDRHERALERGARPVSPRRTATALTALGRLQPPLELLTCGGDMGQQAASAAGLNHRIIYEPRGAPSGPADTVRAARALAAHGIDLLLFVGGDGTARDVLAGVDGNLPVLGVPSGVKMHSAVFAPGAALAGDIAAAFLAGGCNPADLVDAEVMDREEDGHSPRLYGALRVPAVSLWTPHPKAGAAGGAMLDGALSRIAEVIRDDRLTLIGPGATMQALKQRLGVAGTLLGVDVFHNGQLVDTDVAAARILTLLEARQGRIVMSIVGGQGFLFGRGNQQFSPAVIRQVGLRNIVVVAALEKLTALGGQPLYVDTGDDALDQELAGFINVRIGARRSLQYRIAVPTALDAGTLQLSAGAARG